MCGVQGWGEQQLVRNVEGVTSGSTGLSQQRVVYSVLSRGACGGEGWKGTAWVQTPPSHRGTRTCETDLVEPATTLPHIFSSILGIEKVYCEFSTIIYIWKTHEPPKNVVNVLDSKSLFKSAGPISFRLTQNLYICQTNERKFILKTKKIKLHFGQSPLLSPPKHVYNDLTVKTWLKASKVRGENYRNKKTICFKSRFRL